MTASATVLVLQHVPWETPGLIGVALTEAGFELDTRLVIHDADPQLPSVREIAGVVIMGGPMGADQTSRYPGLQAELDLARSAVDADVPVLGICLGHQILAVALGAQLHTGAAPEFGYLPVELHGGDPLTSPLGTAPEVLHWHCDAVDLPAGATLLASSAATANQAFRAGSAVGFQFHPEVDPPLLDQWLAVDEMAAELPRHVRETISADARTLAPAARPAALAAFAAFAASLPGASQAEPGPRY